VENKRFSRKVIPYIDPSYFDEYSDRLMFQAIRAFMTKYNKLPTYNVIKLAMSKKSNLNEDQFEMVMERVQEIEDQKKEDHDEKWLIDETELWCQNQALENAIVSSSEIFQDETKSNHLVKEIITKALAVNFDTHMGIDFFNEKSIAERWKKYNEVTTKYATRLYKMNLVTGGGFEPKTFSCVMGDTGEGKTNALCSIATDFISNGYNVLYITGEMSEEKISQKIEANLLNTEINDIPDVEFETFKVKLLQLKTKSYGNMHIKEYPTGNFSTATIRAYLEEIRIKKNFKPQIVIVDYVNLLRSDRYTEGGSYFIVKAIAEEMRGLAVEYKIALLTGTQVNRTGAGSSDIDMTDIAESYGLPATADFLWAIWSNDELKEMNVQIWNPLKNRFTGIINYKFGVNTDFAHGKTSNLKKDQAGQITLENTEKSKKMMKKFHDKTQLKKLKVNISEPVEKDKDEDDPFAFDD
jgi:archaellum biogenesis ATPase FlaH